MPIVPMAEIPGLPRAIIVDLDGTTALFKNIYRGVDENGVPIFENIRDPYDAEDCHKDIPNKFVIELVKMYKDTGHTVIFVSGRLAKYRTGTVQFLTEQFKWFQETGPECFLYMREIESIGDEIIKADIFKTFIKGKYNITTVIDDRDKVVKMWRELGLNVLQVADGAF